MLPLPHPRALAHLGDAVYELWIRERAIQFAYSSNELHRYTTDRVQAGFQNKLMLALEPSLNEEEKDVARRAQNVAVPTGRRSNQSVYRKATGFEALVGYWYLEFPESLEEKKQRVLQLVGALEKDLDDSDVPPISEQN